MTRFGILVSFAAALGALSFIATLNGSDSAGDLLLAAVVTAVAAILVAPAKEGAA